MNHKVVVGIGNIYASEALFLAKVHPSKPAHAINPLRSQSHRATQPKLVYKPQSHVAATLKDFQKADGKPGYFQNKLYVYGAKKHV